ncbi:Fumarylacetoacetate hydrolase domain-containing protein 2 [Pseudolycoriella hygida]|uniref:Fumarylacetoacetate hydrolase domain-containing protein 2 n=1 Tax=Pseudolycoriella hygida TaxID=35572 RepID=A0A9Q0MQW1_9DIPT|nr:Fumarylacetoacetate hydrolase domain-containing protein 2 [Pseudolycoriella hygida]
MSLKIINITRSVVSCDIFKISCPKNWCNLPNKSAFLNSKSRAQNCVTFVRTYSNSKITNNMRFIQFQRNQSNKSALGVISADGSKFVDISDAYPTDMISFIKSNVPIADIEQRIESLKWEDISGVKLQAPVSNPEKIVCIGLNYLGHCLEQNKEPPSEPMFFSKFASTITGPTGDVILHDITTQLDWEVELAVIIGKEARHVSASSALDHVFGYSVAQDISARDWQKSRNGGQFLIGKSMDTFCPLGPSIVHKSLVTDPHNLRLTCSVNGVPKQLGNTSELIFRINEIIHRLSQSITLKPGDVILTGTPSGVGMHRKPAEFLKVGDVIESEIQSIGKIVNTIVKDTP